MSPKPTFRYLVYSYQSFHLMGDAEKYLHAEFSSCASAVALCEKLVDDFLQSGLGASHSPESLLAEYMSSGPEPYIASDDAACQFSAPDYARRRIREISS